MAICNALNGGIVKTCNNNIGGIKELYLADFENITGITHGSPGDTITAITMFGATQFYKFEFNKNTSTFTEVTTSDATSGAELCIQTITLVLSRRDQAKRDALLLQSKFKKMMCIVKDGNDLYWLLGETDGVMLQEKNSGPGTAKTDANGYTLTYVAEEPEDACEVLSSLIPGLVS